MIRVYNVANAIEADTLAAILKENGIHSFYRDSAHTVAAHGVSGFGLFGVDVYVDDSDADKARGIIESILQNKLHSSE